MSEWKIIKIYETGRVVTGTTPSSKCPEDFGSDIMFVTPSDYKSFTNFITRTVRYLSNDGKLKLKNRVLPVRSIMVTCIGSDMGKVALNPEEVITNQQINSIIPDSLKVNNLFLYYKLKDEYETLRMYGGEGTAVPIINKSTFENIEIIIPPLLEQERIAEVLSSLDDKIDLLQRQNKTLEEMAETLFRQWFVEGADDSWDEVKLCGYVELVSGYSYRSVDLNSSTKALVTLKNFDRTGGFRHDGFKEYTGKYKEDQVVVSGDLIVAHTDITQEAEVLGNPAIVISTDKYETLIISTDLVKVIPTSYLSKVYLYFLMKTDEFKHYCLGASNGTTVLHLSKKALPEYDFKLPNAGLVERFTFIAEPLLEKININQKHIQQLETLRDTLLPKLMSGELRVSR